MNQIFKDAICIFASMYHLCFKPEITGEINYFSFVWVKVRRHLADIKQTSNLM